MPNKKAARPVKVLKGKQPLKKKRKSISSKIVKHKPYLEIVTALLSIPFLITITLLNLNALNNINNANPTPTPQSATVPNSKGFFAAPVESSQTATPSSGKENCIEGLGPVAITSPNENDTVSDNPVYVNISYDDTEYCRAAWSYRINGGNWSGYDDRSVALYNLPPGQITFDLRVKSIVTSDEKSLTRKFIYNGKGTVLVPDNPNSSGSAN